jgi:heavy metal sensor kinase
MNPKSLRFQLVAWYTTLLVLAFAIVSLFMYLALKRVLQESLKELLSRRSRKMAHFTRESTVPITTEWFRAQIIDMYAPETPEANSRFVRFSRADGTVIFQAGPPLDQSFDPADVKQLNLSETRTFRFENAGDDQLLIRLDRVETEQGEFIIETGGAIEGIETQARNMVLPLVFAAPPLILVAAVGAYLLIGRALKPVVRITQSAEEISLQNLADRLPIVHTGDELETLSEALNRMIARLQESMENTRQFIADASHELRTPLAVLRGELENVMSQDRLSDKARDRVASNLEEVERLGKIVQGLFAISRLDCGEAQAETITFDLAKVAETTTEQMCLLAEDKGIKLDCQPGKEVLLRGDPARIKQVLVNLVDNAINYTPEGGRVDVRAFASNGHSVLEVQDTGIGIPEDAQTKIFERFFRVDKARSRDVGGAGLGLSIVKSICLAHGGKILVHSQPGKGSRFRIEFPSAHNNAVGRETKMLG